MNPDGTCVNLDEYPAIKALSGQGPNLPYTCNLLPLPHAAPGSFEDIWYRVYARLWEDQFNCGPMLPQDFLENALLHLVDVWNKVHSSTSTTTYAPTMTQSEVDGLKFQFPPVDEFIRPQAGRDPLMIRHRSNITINRGLSHILHVPPGGFLPPQSGGQGSGSVSPSPSPTSTSTRPSGSSPMSTSSKVLIGTTVAAGLGAFALAAYAHVNSMTFTQGAKHLWSGVASKFHRTPRLRPRARYR
jgi:hypothetical protein